MRHIRVLGLVLFVVLISVHGVYGQSAIAIDFSMFNIPQDFRQPVLDAVRRDAVLMPNYTDFTATSFRQDGDWAEVAITPSYIVQSNWAPPINVNEIRFVLVQRDANQSLNAFLDGGLTYQGIAPSIPNSFLDLSQSDVATNAVTNHLFPWTGGKRWSKTNGWHESWYQAGHYRAVDFAPVESGDTAVLASESGTVRPFCSGDPIQTMVLIDHDDGKSSGYLHITTSSVSSLYGARVSRGQKVGDIYVAWNYSTPCGRGTGPHLHYVFPDTNMTIDGHSAQNVAGSAHGTQFLSSNGSPGGDDTAPPDTNLIRNGNFSSGGDYWDLSDSDTDSQILNGTLLWKAQDSIYSTVYGVVRQDTNYSIPSGSVMELEFDLGNSSGVTKSVTVNLYDQFSGHTSSGVTFNQGGKCKFDLSAGASLRTYRMLVPVTSDWNNQTGVIFEGRPPDGIPDILLDNVSLIRRTNLSISSKRCGLKQPPGEPTITSPQNGAVINASSVDISVSPGALNYTEQADYRFDIATDSGFSNIVWSQDWTTDRTHTVSLEQGQYWLRVRQGDTVSLGSDWRIHSFTMQADAAPDTNLVRNADFNGGTDDWLPSAGATWRVTDGYLMLDELSGVDRGAIYQDLNTSVNDNSTLELSIGMGNTSASARQARLYIRDIEGYTGKILCEFTILPNTPLRRYVMRGKTGEWENIRFELWVDSEESHPGFTMDTVRIRYRDQLDVTGVQCHEPSNQTVWSFDDDQSPYAWVNRIDSSTPKYHTPTTIWYLTTGIDPIIEGPTMTGVFAEDYPNIYIRAKTRNGASCGQIFFDKPDNYFREENSKIFPMISDGQFHDYLIDMSTIPGWSGEIEQLRFDPSCTRDGYVYDSNLDNGVQIDHIELREAEIGVHSLDMNKDGYITPSDAMYVQNRVGGTDLSADVNGDESITQADISLVLDHIGEEVPANQRDDDRDGIPTMYDACPLRGNEGGGLHPNGCPIECEYDADFERLQEVYRTSPGTTPPHEFDYNADGTIDIQDFAIFAQLKCD